MTADARKPGQEPPEAAEDALFVRPFIMTGGRARPVHDGLRLETQVLAAPGAQYAPLEFERRRIVTLCQSPRSVAEVAAGVGVPLGVAKVLVADLLADELLLTRAHQPQELPLELMERIRDHVRSL
ncbi:DUF742 domain-containing protein [Streptacidiphilus monticola]|jgi:hypothetical protein|uniref:DUF742 domain-containing protein n=1 Tax=Streptacidiphilus monticola TaxID=2161674 RepID=A0ABW1G5E9_9ACTN